MSVYKKVQLPSKIICSSAVMSCPEEDMAVATDEGIYNLSLRTAPTTPLTEMVMHITKIEPNPEVNEFDVGIDRDTVQQDIVESGEIVGDFFEIMLNRTLSPAVESLQSNRGFVRAEWSPLRGDPVGRRVLATLTGDHRVSIYTRHSTGRKWEEVVKISHKFQQLMKDEGFLPAEERIKQNDKIEKSKIVRLKERTYLLAAVGVSWSKSFEGTPGEPPPKQQKMQVDNSSPFCFLATTFKSGHLGVWKVKLPVTSDEGTTFSELVDLHTSCPKAIHWCDFDDGNPGMLAVGYMDGVVRLLGLKWIPGAGDLTGCDEPGEAWSHQDNIPIHAISWDTKKKILYFGKGPYLFAMTVNMTADGTFDLGKETHISVSPTVSISEVKLLDDDVWVSTADDLVIMVKVTVSDSNAVSLTLGSRVDSPRELSGAMYPWKNHGFCWTRNKVFICVLSSPGWNYCHLEIRKPLKFDIMSRITPEEATELLLMAPATAPLTQYTDVLVYTRQVYRSTGGFPDILDLLVKDVEGWESLSLFYMKLLRFLLYLEHSFIKEKKERKEELEKLIPKASDLILAITATRNLKAIKSELLTSKAMSKTARLSGWLLARWVSEHASEEEDKTSAHQVIKCLGKVDTETCIICNEDVPLERLQNGSCPNGHSFGRCSQSLVLCQDIPYRVCDGCGTIAINKQPDCDILKNILTNACSLCDCTLLLLS